MVQGVLLYEFKVKKTGLLLGGGGGSNAKKEVTRIVTIIYAKMGSFLNMLRVSIK